MKIILTPKLDKRIKKARSNYRNNKILSWLTKEEREIEKNIEKFVPVDKKEFEKIARSLAGRKKK